MAAADRRLLQGICPKWLPLLLLVWALLAPPVGAEPATELRHDFVTAPDGVPLAVTECGRADAPGVLLIHGFGQSYLSFKKQFTASACARYHLVAFDLRGHGGSGKPWEPAAYGSRERWADDVRAVMQARGLKRPVVVGWSFGGIVAVHYLKVHGADGIRALVLVGSSGGLVPPRSLGGGLSPERLATLARAAATPDIPGQIESANWFISILTAQPRPAAEAEELVAASLMLPAYARRAMQGMPVDNAGLEATLTIPVRFIAGAHDATRDIDALKALAARLPHASVVVYADSGHSPFLEEPDRFNRDLAELVDGP
jgi:pimeloyl-ACP methyl ester carboxylesterase